MTNIIPYGKNIYDISSHVPNHQPYAFILVLGSPRPVRRTRICRQKMRDPPITPPIKQWKFSRTVSMDQNQPDFPLKFTIIFHNHLAMTFTLRHGFSMALIEIDGLPFLTMVDLSMAM